MNATVAPIALARNSLKDLGYSDAMLQEDYSFSDLYREDDRLVTIPLAAFAQEPTSYKTACFGIIHAIGDDPSDIEGYRALGAPQILALDSKEGQCRVWRMRAQGAPELREAFSINDLPQEFQRRQSRWEPSAVLRAKNISFPQEPAQLDFYDIGLIPAIEEIVYEKLDRLLQRVLAECQSIITERQSQTPDYQDLFRLIFRFVAAKLLGDRRYPGDWLNQDAQTVIQQVNTFYFPEQELGGLSQYGVVRNKAWELIRNAFNFQNLSVEALAYVYENTFVDDLTRRENGTHATPKEIAEFAVRELPIETLPAEERTIFEPFAGAAPFLVAGRNHLRELLGTNLDANTRHQYFVRMLSGMELDAFACEVARYSLILADYPNSNGWDILPGDAFVGANLATYLAKANIVLCNPPYEDFSAKERLHYSNLRSHNKAIETLLRVLDNPPAMFAFVLPRVYLNGRSYRDAHQQIEAHYSNIDTLVLPDNVFQHSDTEALLVIAYGNAKETLRRTVSLSRTDYTNFKKTGKVDWTAQPLTRLWSELQHRPRLDSVAEIHRGIQYKPGFNAKNYDYVSSDESLGFAPGLVEAKTSHEAFIVPPRVYMNLDRPLLLANFNYQWNEQKVIVPAASMGRDKWVTVAAIDYDGLYCTQRFHGIWPSIEWPLEIIAALINGPVANAWLFQNANKRDNQRRFFASIPIPEFTPNAIELISRYVEKYIRTQDIALLLRIDAAVLHAYGLPIDVEQELLSWFGNARRPGVPGFAGYGEEFSEAKREYLRDLEDAARGERYHTLVEKSFLEGLTPSEANEKERLSQEIDQQSSLFYEPILQELGQQSGR